MAAKTTKGRRGNTSTPNVKDLKDLSQQGRAAEALLKNTTLTKALNEMKTNAMDRITNSNPDEKELREDFYRFIKSINALEKQLNIYMTKGANAAHKLEVITNGG